MAVAVVLAVFVGVPGASAEALAPWWHLSSSARPTYLPPAGSGDLVATAINVGDESTSIENAKGEPTPVRIVDRLPAGLRAVEVEGVIEQGSNHESLKCEHNAVEATCLVQAETSGTVLPVSPFDLVEVRVGVVVQAGASSGEENEVSVSGGGASDATVKHEITISSAPAPFGVEAYELAPEAAGGQIDTRAGSHPFQTTFTIGLNQAAQTRDSGGHVAASPVGLTRDLQLSFPPGLIADPQAVARCSEVQFTASINECPVSSVVGAAVVTADDPSTIGITTFSVPLFNLESSAGEPARFGFLPEGRETPVYLDTSVATGGNYAVTAQVHQITQAAGILSTVITFWGAPGEQAHDQTRGYSCLESADEQHEYPPCEPLQESEPAPFFELPTSCTGPLRSSVEVDSWESPGNFATGENIVAASAASTPTLDGCNLLQFSPEIGTSSDVQKASTPSGLTVEVHVPQEAGVSPASAASSDIGDIAIALPAGIALNPAGTEGLEACSESQIGFTGFGAPPAPPGGSGSPGSSSAESEADVQTALFTATLPQPLEPGIDFCPNGAKLGTAKITTPILASPLEGAVYLASQNANPFGSLVAVYIVVHNPESGVLVKLPGEVSLSQQTGQITVSLQNTPQLPLEDIELHFFGGERAPLSTPARCGSYTTQATFTPWSGGAQVSSQSSLQITSGPGGGPCPGAGVGGLPFNPSLSAGSTSIQAGGFSPLTITVSRADGQQPLQGLALRLPPGLEGMLSSVPLCPDAQANAGACTAASQIGETTVSAGVGGEPYTLAGGKVYLTAGYDGAPFGLAIVTPVKAGPLDLEDAPENHPACDCLVIRAKIEVDPQTAQLTIATGTGAGAGSGSGEGPDGVGAGGIPSIIDGVPLQIKDLNIAINRPGFIFNPTNCTHLPLTGTISGDEGAGAPVSTPFQVTNCAILKFTPKLSAATQAKTSRAGGASLTVKLSYPAGSFGSRVADPTDANIAALKVDLPKTLPARLKTLRQACLARVFAANPAACPAGSIAGRARVLTPILPVAPPGRDVNLEGPTYFVGRGPGRFPGLVLVLSGDGVRLDLAGTTFIDAKTDVTSLTFKTVPDIPVSSLELTLPEGPHSALAASKNLCKSKLSMPTALVGQNGAEIHESTKVSVTGCPPTRRPTRARKLTPHH